MIRNFVLVKVDSNYCDYLRKFDNRVSYNAGIKELRPFIGILFTVKNCEYYAPLSSPKPKHLNMNNNIDFIKIDNGKLGVVNFNNMIPVTKKNYEILNLDKIDSKRKTLLISQLIWLNKNIRQVIRRAERLYNNYDKLPKKVIDRCCNFKLLEEKCREYNK